MMIAAKLTSILLNYFLNDDRWHIISRTSRIKITLAKPKINFPTIYCSSRGSDILDARVELSDVAASVEFLKENLGPQAKPEVDGASVPDAEVLVNGLVKKIIKLIIRHKTKIKTVNA